MAEELQVHLNGRIVPAAEAKVSVSDAGFLHGASTFTTMRAHRGVVFRLDRHLARLTETVEFLGLRTDVTSEGLAQATEAVLKANALAEARVRITLTPGSGREGEPTTLITAEPLPAYPPQWYRQGIKVVVSAFRQHTGEPTYGHKTGCYFPRVLARQAAAAAGAEEALWYTEDNRLAEACFCNVFLVLGGAVCTPPLATPVLDGVVRQTVLELCDAEGIDRQDEQALTVKEMLAADEMFLTSSCMGVRPVVGVERHVVGEGEVGPVTGKIMAAYAALLDRECGGDSGEESQ
jgi:branched-chain amino acid aminotransferase